MSAPLSSGAEDTRAEFEGKPMPRDYPRSFRRAVAGGRWERASWLEARTAERWLARHVADVRELGGAGSLRFTGENPADSENTPDEGWVFPTATARKAHYIAEGRSLCGSWAYIGSGWLSGNVGGGLSDCKACTRKLAKRPAEQAANPWSGIAASLAVSKSERGAADSCEAQPITFPTSGVINTFRWKLCPGCGYKVWLTKRGKLFRHIPETDRDSHGFAVHSTGIDASVPRCREVKREPDGVICSARGGVDSCAEPMALYCYDYGRSCSRKVSYRPGRGPGLREIYCERHGRQAWPPQFRDACSSPELDR